MADEMVVIVEDEPDIGDLIRLHVEREGYRTRVLRSGREALDAIRKEPPDLVVLDLMLPDLDGMEICRRLRWDERTREVPVLIVSARGEEADVVAGLELGADDYVTKPFSPRVLIARVRNILRRRDVAAEQNGEASKRIVLAGGAVVVDIDRHEIIVDGEPREFTRSEFVILHFLARRPGFVRTRDQIISAMHGESAVLTSRTVDVHVTAIRRKLGDYGAIVTTVRGVGYRLDESKALSEA